MNNAIATGDRIKIIDGLRAVAVLSVVFFHFYYQQISGAGKEHVTPFFLQNIFQYGNMGVYIFFVISGFIISYVTFGKVDTGGYIFKFILRRQIRLDPPFWLTVVLGIALAYVSVKILHNPVYLPNGTDIITNLTYVFDILNRYDIIRVGWTLCLEIQFYLVYILIVFMFSKYAMPKHIRNLFHLLLFFASIGIVSFFGAALSAYIINYWYVFFLGVAITLYLKDQIGLMTYFLILTAPYFLFVASKSMAPVYVSTGTSLIIFLAFKYRQENHWLSSRFFQFFGMISYSLYLLHCLIGNKLIRLLKDKLDWSPDNVILTALILLTSLGISIIFAWLFYITVEKSSIIWSKRFTTQNK